MLEGKEKGTSNLISNMRGKRKKVGIAIQRLTRVNPNLNIPFLRLMVCILFIPCFLLIEKNLPLRVYILAGFALLYSGVLFAMPRVNYSLNKLLPVAIVIDIFIISQAIYSIDKYYLALATFFVLPIIVTSFNSKPYTPLIVTTVISLILLTICYLKNVSLMPAIIQVIIFFITAFFASYLAQHFHQTYFQQANQDTLTKIHNRRYFNFILGKLTENKTPYSLILTDLDNFKKLNDSQGHHHGDYVLKIIAGILKEFTRSYDIVARYGGDEFAVLLPHTGKQESKAIAERIRNSVLVNPRLLPYPNISVSLGIATHPDDGVSAEEIMEKADAALYKSKGQGRNTVSVYTED